MSDVMKLMAACVVALCMYMVGLADGHADGCRITAEAK